MEGIHGIDVSWIHTHNKESPRNHKAPIVNATDVENTSPTKNDVKAPEISPPTPPAETPITTPTQNETHSPKSIPLPPQRIEFNRPGFVKGGSTERLAPIAMTKSGTPSPGTGRRNSWLSGFSSKFSSGSPQNANGSPNAKPAAAAGEVVLRPMSAPRNAVLPRAQKVEGNAPYIPAPVKSNQSNFLTSALRRLSTSGGQLSGVGKIGQHGLCERKVMNVDEHRERCPIAELDQSKVRRVSFCVDVEIAGGPRYNEDMGEDLKTDQTAKKKLVEKGEGEALKRPQAVVEEKEDEGEMNLPSVEILRKEPEVEDTEAADKAQPEEPKEKSGEKKKEKKKRTEEERKARKEKKRRLAEANGTIPVELIRDFSGSSTESTPAPTAPGTPRTQASPTVDPVRIYRRCCQLRETPILKKITEQLSVPSHNRPGVVDKLDLSGYWLQLPDLITLGDYLAVVPVKELIMENCGLTDEGVRVVLAGLLAAKYPDFPMRKKATSPKEKPAVQGGIVERLVLKSNGKIGKDGWRCICLFVYLCHSLKFLDLSMIPFPQTPLTPAESPLSKTTSIASTATTDSQAETLSVFSRALAERLGGSELELLNMAETGITTEQLGDIVTGVCKSGLRRLGLAGNNISAEGMEHVARFIKNGKCEGLDLGGNDIGSRLEPLIDSLDENHPLWALSLANCQMTPDSLSNLFPVLAKLKNFRFIDLSHNHELFETKPSALSLLRRYLPKMAMLKRIHLTDVSMTSEQAIALAEILPESPGLAHVNILENPQLSALASATDEASQEEACALYASLMAAVRVSKTLVCIDIDVPSAESSEVVKALAKQVVAYCLRNMERGPVAEFADAAAQLTEKHGDDKEIEVPDVIFHLVGHVDGNHENHDDDEPAPDDDYVIGGTGVVKALGICLRNKMTDSRRPSQDRLMSEEGRSSPRPVSSGKAKDMSKNLLGSARKIRARLQPALLREEKTASGPVYQKLKFLDSTLEGMIKRFEDEFPETRILPSSTPGAESESLASSAASIHSVELPTSPDQDEPPLNATFSDDEDSNVHPALSRHNSDLSIASRALNEEEGRMHRVGQQFRRDILKPQSLDNGNIHGDGEDPDLTMKEVSLPHLMLLRGLVEGLGGEELQERMSQKGGLEGMAKELIEEKSALRETLIKQDPEGWQKFNEATEAAVRNTEVAGMKTDMSAIE